jgi:hypothetical protein
MVHQEQVELVDLPEQADLQVLPGLRDLLERQDLLEQVELQDLLEQVELMDLLDLLEQAGFLLHLLEDGDGKFPPLPHREGFILIVEVLGVIQTRYTFQKQLWLELIFKQY